MTLSSMFSPAKKADKEFLLELIELIEILTRIKTTQALDLVEKIGEWYIELSTKIETHDYTKEDDLITYFK